MVDDFRTPRVILKCPRPLGCPACQDQIGEKPCRMAGGKGLQIFSFAQRGGTRDAVGVQPGVEFDAVAAAFPDHVGQGVEMARSSIFRAADPSAERIVTGTVDRIPVGPHLKDQHIAAVAAQLGKNF